ncbi:hypothetical protein DID76_02630 [Candidatus Marinamargulisbacteria bacterium SCGC AG-414-C22]|nr:hypothetical protein DID76_02630 [Candidatus Marinamargulisbacteria bacterium SCGC AG-414-C22]
MFKLLSVVIGNVRLVDLGRQGLDSEGRPFGYATVEKPVKQGDVVYRVPLTYGAGGNVSAIQHWQAFQVGQKLFAIDPVIIGVNHDCNPSVFFRPQYGDDKKVKEVEVVARRDIHPIIGDRTESNSNDVITFHYLVNETHMQANFSCSCVTCVVKPESKRSIIHGLSTVPLGQVSALLYSQLPHDDTQWMPQVKAYHTDIKKQALVKIIQWYQNIPK